MSILFAAPGKYIQGRNELCRLSRHLSALGSNALSPQVSPASHASAPR